MEIENKYIIYNVSDALSSGAVEYLGSKRKGWLTYRLDGKDTRILFKQGRTGTGENWAEKVACKLAGLLNLPHASYELAYLNKNDPCVISPNFLEEGNELKLGNELIEGFDKDQRFNNTKHTLNAMLNVLQQNNVGLPLGLSKQTLVINSANDLFIGYLCFDAWIGNTDRHAENWGIITKGNNINILAPTFDHASSLGRNEPDQKRIERLKTKDQGFSVQAYVRGAMVPIYDNDGCQLNAITLIKECKKYNPQITKYWIAKIIEIMNNEQQIKKILDLVPDEFISEPAKDFALAILKESVKRLKEI